ncbi:MAG: SUMF1/EgtB/PvdO family nonheme iron enzyme [Bacteroidota bacterium]
MDPSRNLFYSDSPENDIPLRRNHFLGIGINTYQKQPLNNAVKDVKDIAALLQKDYRFEEEDIYLLLDEEANRANIIEQLRDLTGTLGPNDNLLLYYAGHGTYDEVFQEGFWIPAGAERSSQYLANSLLIKIVQAMRAHHILMVVDACFAGTVFSTARSEVSKYDREPSRYVICSGAKEIVSDGKAGTNSPFAKRMLSFLGKAKEEHILATDLAQHVKKGSFKQKPLAQALHIDGHEDGEFVFYRREDPLTKEEKAFAHAKALGTERAYDAFLEAFPAGKYVEEAENLMELAGEREIWQKAQRKGTITALRRFIRSHPKSPFLTEAQDLLAAKRAEEAKEWEPEVSVPQPKAKVVEAKPKKPKLDISLPEMVLVEGNEEIETFEIGKYPLTQGEWKAVMGDNHSSFKGDPRLPVEKVSWHDAQAFIKKLNAQSDLNFRLPRAAEWEYAAKGGRRSHGYNFAGSNTLNEVGWNKDNSNHKIHPVGEKAPNELDIYDMSGNVWEWCEEIHEIGASFHWLRGGHWGSDPASCVVSFRGGYSEVGGRYYGIGFRLARTL